MSQHRCTLAILVHTNRHMLKRLEIVGFKSFARKTIFDFSSTVTAIVGPNGSGKSNITEAFRFALGEQSMKNMRSKRGEDLIFNGSPTAARTNRGAVAIVFDNTSRVFNIDFDEVIIERAVFRDGASEYLLNGSRVRLRDIYELLANANIGESGHHIISQGEADRILLANPQERREIIKDALGLAVYEFKKQEAQRKLGKTKENIIQVEASRRELTPHIHFLEKQVERLERADALRLELSVASAEYFAIEDSYLLKEKTLATEAHMHAIKQLAKLMAELSALSDRVIGDDEGASRAHKVRAAEKALEHANEEYNALIREVGRTEGALTAAMARHQTIKNEQYIKIPREDIQTLSEEIEIQTKQALTEDESRMRASLIAIRTVIRSFFAQFDSKTEVMLSDEEQTLHTLEREKEKNTEKEAALSEVVEKARNTVSRAREILAAHEEAGIEGQRRLISLAQAKANEETAVARELARIKVLSERYRNCERDKAEMLSLVGPNAVSYEHRTNISHDEYASQGDRRRSIERLNIRLDEVGVAGEDIRKEYKEVSAREQFLTRELADLAHSAEGLHTLINDIDEEITKNFSDGLARINESFSTFFSLMFGGGTARLILEDSISSDEEMEQQDSLIQKQGVDVVVHIPQKKVQSLIQLSGGERALTSIALIFAMSQVNPPPFLILDETDSALDEANSRRYGDMIENLAKQSQLIVVTHNRETMSRAGILYGVTMGNDGISKKLSVKFEDAVTVAKR